MTLIDDLSRVVAVGLKMKQSIDAVDTVRDSLHRLIKGTLTRDVLLVLADFFP